MKVKCFQPPVEPQGVSGARGPRAQWEVSGPRVLQWGSQLSGDGSGDRGLTHTRWARQGGQPPPKGFRKETSSPLSSDSSLCNPFEVPEK